MERQSSEAPYQRALWRTWKLSLAQDTFGVSSSANCLLQVELGLVEPSKRLVVTSNTSKKLVVTLNPCRYLKHRESSFHPSRFRLSLGAQDGGGEEQRAVPGEVQQGLHHAQAALREGQARPGAQAHRRVRAEEQARGVWPSLLSGFLFMMNKDSECLTVRLHCYTL